MTYRVQLTPRAADELAALPPKAQRRIARKIDALAVNPRPRASKKLQGADDLYRIRSGDYRILYQIADKVLTVLVVRVGHRRDVYRRPLGR